jgi:hypothetical protein
MPEQYRADRGDRPRRRIEAASARLFICAECRVQALICSCCDRGQIYCAGDCRRLVRRRRQRAAGARYQGSHRGRRAHAERASRYRARREKVTHHGSPRSAPGGCLPSGSRKIASGATISGRWPWRAAPCCHWCGRQCAVLVRQGFLRRRGRPRDRTGRCHGDTS